jgi:hypothetical protein
MENPIPQNIPPIATQPNPVVHPAPKISSATVPPFSSIPSIQPVVVHSNKKKIKWLIIGIFSLLTLGAAGVFGYTYFFPSPEKVLQRMSLNIGDISSIEYSGNIAFEIDKAAIKDNILIPVDESDPNKTFETASFSFTGISDLNAVDNPQNSFALTTKIDALKDKGNFGIEFKNIEKAFYIRLTSAPELGFFNLKPVENMWLKVEQKQLDEQFDTEKLKERKDTIQKELTPEKVKQLRTVFFDSKVFQITETLPAETIDGRNMFHYRYNIDKEGIKRFVQEANGIMQNDPLTSEDISRMNEELKNMETPTGEIWIGKKDYLPYKFTLESTYKKINETEGNVRTIITIQVKNYNQPVTIPVPTPTKNFEEFVAALFSEQPVLQSLLGGNTSGDVINVEGNKDTDGDTLSDIMEDYYGTAIDNPDTDGDGYNDADEIINGFNPKGPGKQIPTTDKDGIWQDHWYNEE